ncbi:concanavalin A-like lectin/glucanase domain-containing protein, partial [Immersiella caudata]
YELDTVYKGKTFFDGFDFNTTPDGSSGYVKYLSKGEAESKNVIKAYTNSVTIGVDKNTPTGNNGRGTVKIESKKSFESGLFVARFKHFPQKTCGAWPSFFLFGPQWPNNGELDIYKQWNEASHNSISAVTNETVAGQCKLNPSKYEGATETFNCDVDTPAQFFGQGCSVKETDGQWSKSTGGTYAVQWTDDFIKVWSWPYSSTPSNVKSEHPVPKEMGSGSWGKAHWAVYKETCNIQTAFNSLKIALNIDFCRDCYGSDNQWPWSCKQKTGKSSCESYIKSLSSSKLNDLYWEVEDIKVFQ